MASPAVRVSPTREAPTHDVSLSDGAETIGLRFLDDLRRNILQEIPISPPSRPYSTRQATWFGGSRRLNFKDDPNGFYESYGMWTMTDGKLFPRPIEKFATGHRDQEMNQPGSVEWVPMLPTARTYIEQSFTASATSNRREVWLWLRYVGAPGNLTVAIYSDSAGDPNVLQTSTTVTTTTVNTYGWHRILLPANVAVTSGTDYHIVLQATSTDNLGNHWEVGMEAANGAQRSADGSTWALMSYTLYYRVTTLKVGRQWMHFQLYGAEYKVSNNDDRAGSSLMINGERGRATSGTASTLTDTGEGVSGAWTTDQWAGCKIRIINGVGDGQIRTITANNTSGQITVTPDWDVTPTATSEYVIYDTPIWQSISGHGLAEVYGRPVVAHNIAYFPQGSGDNIRMMHIDYADADVHAFQDDGTNKAGVMEVFYDPDVGLQLWKAGYGSAAVAYCTPVAWGSNNTYTNISGTYVGTSDQNITNMVAREALYIFKENSMWKMVKNRPVQINTGMEYGPSPFNGKMAIAGNNEFWWGWNHSIVRMIGGSISDMMNFRQGWQGLPSDRQGIPMSGCNAGAWWFFGMDGRVSDRSTILVWNGYGFMELYRGPAANLRIQNVYWLAGPLARPKLYFDVGGDSMYIEFPLHNSNPLNDTSLSYSPFAELVTTIFDAGEPTLEKVLNKVSVLAYGGGRGVFNGRVKVYFQVDDEITPVASGSNATWHYLGELTGPKRINRVKSLDMVANFGEVNRYRLKLEIFSTSATNPIVILGIEHFGDIFTPLQYRWVGTFKVDSNQLTRNGDPDFSPDFILDFLRRAYEEGKVLQMRSIIDNMDDRAVVVSNAPVPVYQWVRAEDSKAKWGGYITIGLKEPG